jgi:hypothetical protein
MPEAVVIDSEDTLLSLTAARAFVFRLHGGELALNFPAAAETRQYWQRRLNRSYSDCGCGVGAMVTLGSIAAYLAFLAMHTQTGSSAPHIKVLVGFGIAAVSAVAGKFLGLFLACKKFRAEVDAFLRDLRQSNIALDSSREQG